MGEEPGGRGSFEALRQNNKPRTLANLIGWYIDTFEKISRWQRVRAVSH